MTFLDKVELKCVLAKNPSKEERCDLVIGAGALSLIIGILFAVVNILALVLNAALALVVFAGGRRGVLAIVDLVLSIILAIIWFAAGVYIASDWKDARKVSLITDDMKKSGDATVVFCFVSFAAWVWDFFQRCFSLCCVRFLWSRKGH